MSDGDFITFNLIALAIALAIFGLNFLPGV